MHLSKKAEYGLRAVIHLGIAREIGLDHVSITDLAEANQLPLKFLERILQEMRSAELVASKRGKGGGYYLLKSSQNIKIGDIVRLMDGRLAPICCASEADYKQCSCPDEDHCGLRMLMIDVRNAISAILDKYTLEQVVEVTLRKMKRDGITHPFARVQKAHSAGGTKKSYHDPADGFIAELKQSLS